MARPVEDDLGMDLAQLRKVKRRLRQALKALEELEAWHVRMRKAPRPRRATPAEVDAARELCRTGPHREADNGGR